MDPAMVKKRRMMTQWVEWLEKQEAAAIEADPMLEDRNAIAKLVAAKRRERNRLSALRRSKDGRAVEAA
jgi:hypothetical protein